MSPSYANKENSEPNTPFHPATSRITPLSLLTPSWKPSDVLFNHSSNKQQLLDSSPSPCKAAVLAPLLRHFSSSHRHGPSPFLDYRPSLPVPDSPSPLTSLHDLPEEASLENQDSIQDEQNVDQVSETTDDLEEEQDEVGVDEVVEIQVIVGVVQGRVIAHEVQSDVVEDSDAVEPMSNLDDTEEAEEEEDVHDALPGQSTDLQDSTSDLSLVPVEQSVEANLPDEILVSEAETQPSNVVEVSSVLAVVEIGQSVNECENEISAAIEQESEVIDLEASSEENPASETHSQRSLSGSESPVLEEADALLQAEDDEGFSDDCSEEVQEDVFGKLPNLPSPIRTYEPASRSQTPPPESKVAIEKTSESNLDIVPNATNLELEEPGTFDEVELEPQSEGAHTVNYSEEALENLPTSPLQSPTREAAAPVSTTPLLSTTSSISISTPSLGPIPTTRSLMYDAPTAQRQFSKQSLKSRAVASSSSSSSTTAPPRHPVTSSQPSTKSGSAPAPNHLLTASPKKVERKPIGRPISRLPVVGGGPPRALDPIPRPGSSSSNGSTSSSSGIAPPPRSRPTISSAARQVIPPSRVATTTFRRPVFTPSVSTKERAVPRGLTLTSRPDLNVGPEKKFARRTAETKPPARPATTSAPLSSPPVAASLARSSSGTALTTTNAAPVKVLPPSPVHAPNLSSMVASPTKAQAAPQKPLAALSRSNSVSAIAPPPLINSSPAKSHATTSSQPLFANTAIPSALSAPAERIQATVAANLFGAPKSRPRRARAPTFEEVAPPPLPSFIAVSSNPAPMETVKELPPVRQISCRPAPVLTQEELSQVTHRNTKKNKTNYNILDIQTVHIDARRPPSPTAKIRRSTENEGSAGRPTTKEGRAARAAKRRSALRSSTDGSELLLLQSELGNEDERAGIEEAPLVHFRAAGDEEQYRSPARIEKIKGKLAKSDLKRRRVRWDKALVFEGPLPDQGRSKMDSIIKAVPLDEFGNATKVPALPKPTSVRVTMRIFIGDDE